jgi:hypothetical protein
MLPPPSGLVTLLSDFGLDDPYVGVMRGMVRCAHRRAETIDLSHGVPPGDVLVAGLFLRAAAGRFPPGTVHVAVVDPGVGTGRRILAAAVEGAYWLAPDNGLLGPLLAASSGAELREVRRENLGLRGTISTTFHGRDVFAPVAGLLSSGRYSFRSVGPRVTDPVRLAAWDDARPRVIHVDRFGNLITNVPRPPTGSFAVRIGAARLPIAATYASMPPGRPVALWNSYDLLELAIHGGDARAQLGLDVGAPIDLEPA